MVFRSWLPSGGRTRHGRRKAPAALPARPILELLEDRLTPSGTGLPTASGPALTQEGSLYTLQLDAQGNTLQQWSIDWGDDTVDTVAGSATSATHTYADGPADRTITATATVTQAANLTFFQWAVADGGNGHYYALTQTTETWLSAEAEAVGLGGHLASITSQGEQDFLVNTFLSGANGQNVYWPGLTDQAVEGTFVWTSGEDVTYTNWQSGEPNNFLGVEDFVAINWHFSFNIGSFATWNDLPVNGYNLNTNGGTQLYSGLMEFTTLPTLTSTSTSILPVNVQNVAPTASVSGPASAVRGQTLTFTVGASDVSAADQTAGFTYKIDWDGNGTVDETVNDTTVQHTFATAGTFNVRVTATDKDGGESAVATQAVDIRAAALQGGQLVVGGTPGNDLIVLVRENNQGAVHVFINNHDEGVFTPTNGVVAHGYDGNDLIL